jgi:uncharacterized membrane protein YfcA
MSGKRVPSSTGTKQSSLKPGWILMYCLFGIIAGLVAGLLGVGGGFILGPLFLELGIPPQVPSTIYKMPYFQKKLFAFFFVSYSNILYEKLKF